MKKCDLIKRCALLFFLLIFLPPLPAHTEEKQFGDVDENGMINIIDALLTAQYSVGLWLNPNDFNGNTANVNLDRNVDIIDALLIARYTVGLISTFRADEVYADFQTQLDAARELWMNMGIDKYQFDQMQLYSWVIGGIHFILQVDDNTILSVVNREDGQPVPDDQLDLFFTLDDLFAEIQTALNQKYIILDLQFDPVYAYPTYLSIDYAILPVDDEKIWTNSELKPLRKAIITSLPPAKLQDDPFTLNSASVNGDILSTALVYSGGCVEHGYTLYAQDTFMESDPVQINCYISHDGMDDMCDAIISDTPCFDLSPIRELYEEMYGAEDTIIINLYGYLVSEPGEPIQLVYNPLQVFSFSCQVVPHEKSPEF